MDVEGFNGDVEFEVVGPVDPGEIKDIIAAIEDEGSHFARVPPPQYQYPFVTMGRETLRKQKEENWFADAEEHAPEECTTGG